jgi:hypothetical protein
MSLRALRLLGVAAQAEGLRMRRGAARGIRGAVLTGAAVSFGAAALLLFHVAAWLWLAARWDAVAASLLLGLADAVLAAFLLLLARDRPDPVADAALLIRQESLREAARVPLISETVELLSGRSVTALLGGVVAEGIRHALARR